MSDLNIPISVAEAASQKFSQAASILTRISASTSSVRRTNVFGQSIAQSTLQRMNAVGPQVSNALVRDGNNIHSVAAEFVAIDQELGKGFSSVSLPKGLGKS